MACCMISMLTGVIADLPGLLPYSPLFIRFVSLSEGMVFCPCNWMEDTYDAYVYIEV